MLSLSLKDIRISKIYFIISFVFWIFFTPAITEARKEFQVIFLAGISVIMLIIPFNIEARYKVSMLFKSLPVSADKYVISKYISSIFLSTITIISCYGFIILFSNLLERSNSALNVIDLLKALFLSVVITGLLLPFLFKLDIMISTAISVFLASLTFASYYYLDVLISVIGINRYILLGLMVLIALGIISLSYLNSLKIYRKKEL